MKTYLYDLYAAFRQHPHITTDSRNIVPGSIFFALKGDKFNGNAFAKEALEKGASYVVIDEQKYFEGSRFFLVENVFRTLQELAIHHRLQHDIPIIGITGTNGKTTTKELITKVLSQKFKTCATPGNLNNHIGVPLSILKIKPDDEIAVIEMGANHPGEIASLCQIARPTYGLITNIGKAHLEGFGSYEGVITAKNELYQYLQKTEGHVFVNGNDDLLMNLCRNIKKTTYGTPENADVSGKLASLFPYISVLLKLDKIVETINTRLLGAYNFDNVMAAACVGNFFGVAAADIQAAIENYSPTNNRSQVVDTQNNKVILDAYNANPTSMEAAIRNFAQYPALNKMLILGDMLELGVSSHTEHLRIIDIVGTLGINNEAFLVGKYFRNALKNDEMHSFLNINEAKHWFKKNKPENKTILVKGSRGIMLEMLMPFL